MKKEKQIAAIEQFKAGKYFCSKSGSVYSTYRDKNGLKMKPDLRKEGYVFQTICYKSKFYRIGIHNLIWLFFNGGYKTGLEINHINGIKTDNRLSNLELVTSSENSKHAFKIGLQSNKGVKNAMSKLTELEVLNIRELYKTGKYSYSQLSKLLGINAGTIACVANRSRWKHLP